jgi:hypothetical protein
VRILFVLLRPVYLRYFDSTIGLLAARGHAVHLGFADRGGRDGVSLARAEQFAGEHPGVTYDLAPRSRSQVAAAVRLTGDFGRYLDPAFDAAPRLRTRAQQTLAEAARASSAPAPIGQAVAAGSRWLARHPSRAVARLLTTASLRAERALPVPAHVREYVSDREPDVVLASPVVGFGSSQVEYLKAARELGIPSAVCVASWDNLTSKGLIRGDPERVFVWNEAQRREAARLHGVPPSRVAVTGAPRFDRWFEKQPSRPAAVFRSQVGLPPDLPHVLYLCSSSFIAPDEAGFVRRWIAAIRARGGPGLADAGVLVRPHPQNREALDRANLGELENVSVWPRHGGEVLDERSEADFFDSIAHSRGVVGVNTSAQIEACILGKPVYTVGSAELADAQTGTLHYQYLQRRQGGFLHEASTLEEHVDQLRRASTHDADAARRFVESFVRPMGIDRPATPLLCDHVERLGRSPRPAIG